MKASCVPIWGILGHVIVNWDTQKKLKQNDNFWLINSLIIPVPLDMQSWNLDTMWIVGAYVSLMQTKFEGARSQDQTFTAENGQKVNESEPIYLGNYRYWWKMVFERTINHISFGYVRLPQLETYFSCFASFFPFFFSFPSAAIDFLNR